MKRANTHFPNDLEKYKLEQEMKVKQSDLWFEGKCVRCESNACL